MQCQLFLKLNGFDREGTCSSLGEFRCRDHCNKAQIFQPWPIINGTSSSTKDGSNVKFIAVQCQGHSACANCVSQSTSFYNGGLTVDWQPRLVGLPPAFPAAILHLHNVAFRLLMSDI